MDDVAYLIVTEGPDEGRRLAVTADGAKLGRGPRNEIVLNDPGLSRHHCRFFFKTGCLCVIDLASANNTIVNGVPIKESGLRTNDVLSIGHTKLKVLSNTIHEPLRLKVKQPTEVEVPPPPKPRRGLSIVRIMLSLFLIAWLLFLTYSLFLGK